MLFGEILLVYIMYDYRKDGFQVPFILQKNDKGERKILFEKIIMALNNNSESFGYISRNSGSDAFTKL